MPLAPGRTVRAVVPATSANLGPGFDALGLALELHDEVVVRVTGEVDLHVDVEGEGADSVPRDARHLVVSALLHGLEAYGVGADSVLAAGLAVSCTNRIPHGRGLGSSAAAIVSGLVAARELAGADEGDADLLVRAAALEGHPDNVAAALLGGLTVAWSEAGEARAVSLAVHADVRAVALVPDRAVPTDVARGLLPPSVPHDDAARNAGRSALLVAALTQRPDLLPAATEDALHQPYRAPAMPETAALVADLRARGLAAVVSGAGPTVLVLGREAEAASVEGAPPAGFRVHRLGLSTTGARASTLT